MECRGATVIIGQGLLRWGGSNAHFVDGLVGPALGVDVQVDAVVCHPVQVVLPVQHLDGHPLAVVRYQHVFPLAKAS